VDVVTKPIDPDVLKLRVRNFMRYVELRKQVQSKYDVMLALERLHENVEHIILSPDSVLCTDGAAAYKIATKHLGIAHRAINLSAGVRVLAGVCHIQNVNAYDSRLKGWMERFHGVAAKYLENYLGWRRWLERWSQDNSPRITLWAVMGWENRFQQIMQT
jgi:hypothetical protein